MVGSAVGPYEVVERLGAGGMGEVFLGRDTRLERKVALKCLAPTPDGRDSTDRILREARAAARLNHPNIAGVHDVVEHGGRAFIVMEYVEGESLRSRLDQRPVSIGEAVGIARQLASALAAAHAEGVVHRDLKPANVQLAADGSAKILDFGIAAVAPRDDGTQRNLTSRETATGGAGLEHAGTPTYMAPEQLIAGITDARSDIYSLGLILFEMVTGRRPFSASDTIALVVAVSTSPPVSAREINPAVPEALSAIIATALEHDPANRFQSAAEFERALAAFGNTGQSRADGVQRIAVRRIAVRSSALALGVVIAAIVAWPLLSRAFRSTAAPLAPAAFAILPADNPTGDPLASHLGVEILGTVARNLRSVRGALVLTREATAAVGRERRDHERIARDLNASYVLDVGIAATAPDVRLSARLWRRGATVPVFDEAFGGDPSAVERALVERLLSAVRSSGDRRMAFAGDPERLLAMPTRHGGAFAKYVEARVLLERNEVPGNVERALALLQQATRDDPKYASGFAGLADALRMRSVTTSDDSLLEEARAAAARALQLDPQAPAAHVAWANVQNASGRRDAAITSLRRALDLQPDNDSAHRTLGRVYADQGRIEDAVASLRQAIRIRPDYFNHHWTLGGVLWSASRYEDALDAYRHASELEPQNSVAHSMIGATYHMLGRMDQAIGHYQHALRLQPNATAYANLGWAYFTADRFQDALAQYLAAAKLDPHKASLHRDLGDVYRRLSRTRDARIAYERAIALAHEGLAVNSRDAFAVVLIALCEANLGRRADAERHAAEALVLAPHNRDVLFRVAKTYAIAGNTDAALAQLRQAIARGYDPQLARTDPELADLRRSPAFEQAIADAKTVTPS